MLSEEDKDEIRKLINEQFEILRMELANRNLDGSSKDAVVQSGPEPDGQERLPVQSAQPAEVFLKWIEACREELRDVLTRMEHKATRETLQKNLFLLGIVEKWFRKIFGIKKTQRRNRK